MDSFSPEGTVLEQTDLKRSFSKALNFQNGAARNEIDICNVLNFIKTHLDDTNPEISYLIECNLCYLRYYLGNFSLAFTNNGENVRSNYNLDARRKIEATWISNGIEVHKLLMTIIEKYKDAEWMSKNKGRHSVCVYYALRIMGHLCMGQDKKNINTIIKQTDIIKTSLDILSYKNHQTITFLEQFATIRLLNLLIHHGSNIIDILCDMKQTYDLNVIKLLISECCNSFQVLLRHKQLSTHQNIILSKHASQIEERVDVEEKKESDEMMTYSRSPLADKNVNTKTLHLLAYKNRMTCIQSLRHLAKQIRNPKWMDILCNEKDVTPIYLKRLLQVSLFYMRQGKIAYPPQVNTIDIISVLVQNKSITEILVCDKEILEMLIIAIRTRSHMCEFGHRGLIVILYCIVCEHELLPKRYYHDLILVLNDIKEVNWKNISFHSNIFPHYTLSIMIIKMLKKLFGVREFEKTNQAKYQCAICQDQVQYPYQVSCGHSFCFGCLDLLIASSTTFYQYFIQNNRHEPNKCPLCRSAIIGSLSRNDKQSDFTLNKKLMNQMNAELICFKDEKKSEFEGTEHEFWEHMKTNYGETSLKNEFVNFCEFMKKKTKICMKRKQFISIANQSKLEGNKFFKAKEYANAIEKYTEALNICPLDEYKLRSKYYSNIALCYVNMKNYFNAYRAVQNGLALIYSPSEDRTFVKLTNNLAISLSELLKDNKIFNEHHNIIQIGADNLLCPNRRSYDILLYQCSWDFHYYHSTYTLLDSGVQTVENMMKIKKNDAYLLKIMKIEQEIDNYLQLNFDEYQLKQCLILMKQEKQSNAEEEEKNENTQQLDYDVIKLHLYMWES